MTDLIKDEELQQYGITPDMLLEKFYAQLHKDFEMSALDSYLQLPAGLPFDEIKSRLSKILEKISNTSSTRLRELIYRIDISDKQYSEALRTAKEPMMDVIAELIIKRILQKVILKIVYSK